MTAPLARDQSGQPFELPPTAVFWRVRRHTGGRPSSVLGADGELLFVPIGADLGELAASVGASGSYRLEAVDEQRKSVGAPVAYVELTHPGSEGRALPTSGNDLAVARMADALARVTESNNKQEGVIALAREMAHAMTSMQQTQTAIMVALVQGKYPSPAAFAQASGGGMKEQIQQWLDVQKLLRKDEDAQRRNVVALDAPAADGDDKLSLLVNAIAPHLGQLTSAGVMRLLGVPPEQAMAMMGAQQLPADAFRNGAPDDGADETAAPEAPAPFKVAPKVLREVWAQLDDDDAQRFGEILGDNTEEQVTIFAGEVARRAPADRIQFVHETMATIAHKNGESIPARPPNAPPPPSELPIPDAFKPLFAQLSPDEQQTAARMVSRLNVDAIKELGAALLMLAPPAQLQKVRQMIATFHKREASSAQRAVFSVLRGEGTEGGQAA